MLLRRVIDHVKTQNWTAVSLDFFIVVVGVFVGLQVSNWNDSRQDRLLEQKYLERLEVEILKSLDHQNGRQEWNDGRVKDGDLVLTVLRGKELAEKDKAAFNRGLYLMGVVSPLRPSWGVVEELQETGNIQLLQNLEIRERLIDFENDFLFRQEIMDTERDIVKTLRAQLHNKYETIGGEIDPNDDVKLNYDIEDLFADIRFINNVSHIHTYQRLVHVMRQEQLDDLEKLLVEVRAAQPTR